MSFFSRFLKHFDRESTFLDLTSVESQRIVNQLTDLKVREIHVEGEDQWSKWSFDQFQEVVDEMVQGRRPGVIGKNSSKEHAILVLSALIDNAKDEIKIYDRDLSGDLLTEAKNALYDKLKNFIEKDESNRVYFIVHDSDKNQEMIDQLNDFGKGRIEIKIIKDSSIANDKLSNIPYFAVNDKNSYRVENKSVADLGHRSANFAFDDREYGALLNRIFENIESEEEFFA